jgi:hypothetical protein
MLAGVATFRWWAFVRLVLKIIGWGLLALVTTLVVAHFAWKHYESPEWAPVLQDRGVTVQSRKLSGTTVLHFKVQTRIGGNLNSAMSAMLDPGTCGEWFPGCTGEKQLQAWDPKTMSQVYFWLAGFEPPFDAREFILKMLVTPDAATKSVKVEFMAVPDALPRNDCCFRVVDMHNIWRFADAGPGKIDIEFRQAMDLQLPYFIFNKFAPKALVELFADQLPHLLNKEKYRGMRHDFIDALGASG